MSANSERPSHRPKPPREDDLSEDPARRELVADPPPRTFRGEPLLAEHVADQPAERRLPRCVTSNGVAKERVAVLRLLRRRPEDVQPAPHLDRADDVLGLRLEILDHADPTHPN